MKKENKKFYGVFTEIDFNDNGTLERKEILYDDYEKDVIKSANVFLDDFNSLEFQFSKGAIIFFKGKNNGNEELYYMEDINGAYIVGIVNGVSYAHIPYLAKGTQQNNDTEKLEEDYKVLSPATIGYRLAGVLYSKELFNLKCIDWNNMYGDYQSKVISRLQPGMYSEKIKRERKIL